MVGSPFQLGEKSRISEPSTVSPPTNGGGIWHPEKETSPKNTPLEARPMWPLGPRSNEPRRGIYQGLSHFGRIKVDANVWSFWGVSLGTVHEVWVGVIMIFFFRLEDVWLLRIAENAWVGSRSSESWGLGKKQGRMCCFPFGWILFFLDSKDERSGIVSTCIFFRWLTRNDVTESEGPTPVPHPAQCHFLPIKIAGLMFRDYVAHHHPRS